MSANIIVSNDASNGTPNVPDACSQPKWKHYIWRRNGSGSNVNLYLWDDTAASDATLLKWKTLPSFVTYDLGNYADDAAASTGGVQVGGLYHTSGTVKVRLT
tara:strand:+ start:923 stop:1228 length:306 start_codon:yes stop_codon:yes gene_type:complete